MIRRGYDAELDELHADRQRRQGWIARFQAEEIRRTGIASLKVGFNQVFGYYIEITHTHARQDPGRLPAQADAQERRALHHAGAEGVRGEGPRRRGDASSSSSTSCSSPCATRSPPRPAGCCRRPRCWPRSTCWRPWPSWRRHAATAARSLTDEPILQVTRRPTPGARSDAAAGDVRAQRRVARPRRTARSGSSPART